MMSSRLVVLSIVALFMPLTGCVETKAPSIYTACQTAPQGTEATKVENPAPLACTYSVPKLRPHFHRIQKSTTVGTLKIQYGTEAMQAGAPQNLPTFDLNLQIKGDSIDLGLFTQQVSIWRIHAAPNTIQESRHPLLDTHLSAKALIRDITFMYWPTDTLTTLVTALCRDCKVTVRGKQRLLTRGGYTLLEMTEDDKTMTLRNFPEGYTLTIQKASS